MAFADRKTRYRLWTLGFCLAVAAAACTPGNPIQFENIQLGRSLNSDNSVGNHTTRFKPDDTVYVALLNGQPGSGEVTVRWVLNGQVVKEESATCRIPASPPQSSTCRTPAASRPAATASTFSSTGSRRALGNSE
jgi:hypothetical protein